ncbi:U-box domain-containing protein 8-like, partial [Telopea speciosissima]|uniref:U-box domain-containing protein 8-like n=1 Tax=Telopea speciosissima TaxID=54955 RepID=UPI001CC623E3
LNLNLDDDNKVGLVAEGAIQRVVGVLQSEGGTPNCRALAATMLTSLAVVEVNKATIGSYPFAIKALVSLLRDGSSREKKQAATALDALCSFPDNKKRVVECGAVQILIQMADSWVDRAFEVLSLLAKCKEGREEMARFDGCVPILVGVLRNGTSRSVQHALSALISICSYSEQVGSEARREGVVDICLGLLDDESEKITRNASSLIQGLRKYKPTS